jgi:hypothetical protein
MGVVSGFDQGFNLRPAAADPFDKIFLGQNGDKDAQGLGLAGCIRLRAGRQSSTNSMPSTGSGKQRGCGSFSWWTCNVCVPEQPAG